MLTRAFQDSLHTSLTPLEPLLRRLHGRRVLITGANGLIPGTLLASLALARRMLDIEVEVTALYHNRRDHIDVLLAAGHHHIHAIKSDLSRELPAEVYDTPHDFIVHGASLASPVKYLHHRMDTIRVNVVATLQLLELAQTQHCTNMLYVGSGEVYGGPEPQDVPTPETFKPRVNHLGDRGCYSESKRFAETVCLQWHLETGATVCCVRPIHVFGPGLAADDGRVVADFLANAVAGNDIVVQSDGSDRRAFCYSLDANIMLLHVLLAHTRGFEVFNIGNPGNDVSIAELAGLTAELGGVGVDIRGVKPASAKETPARSAPDIAKFVETFDYRPRFDLREGLQKTLEWMRDYATV